MKLKSLYILAALICVFSSAFSQGWVLEEGDYLDREDEFETEMEIGVEAGPALTTSWGHNYTIRMEGQYCFGVYYRGQFEPWFGIQSGAYIERVGTDFDITFVDGSGNTTGTGYRKYRFDFITCPIMWKFTPIHKRFHLHFSVGGFFSYMFSAESVQSPYPAGTPGDPNPGKENIFDEETSFSNINGGAILGAGVDYNFDFGLKLGFEMRDQLGFVHIYNAPQTPNFAFRTNSLQFLGRIAYGF